MLQASEKDLPVLGIFLRPKSAEIIPIKFQGADLFSKAKLHGEFKYLFKKIMIGTISALLGRIDI